MHILWSGTKSPYPPDDGGRLVTWLTLQELHRRGHRITLIAPAPAAPAPSSDVHEQLRALCTPLLLPSPLPGLARTVVRSLALRLPLTAARHRHPRIRRRVEQLVRTDPTIDLVHVEQLQAMVLGAHPTIPVVLRAQNVESDLWRSAAAVQAGVRRLLLELEGRRIARYEATVLARPEAVLALTHRDARRLCELSGHRIIAAPPPFPERLPPGSMPLAGDPPLVVLGAGGWLPNRDGTIWLLRHLWPGMRRRLPDAVLHLFGWDARRPRDERIVVHPRPTRSADAFAPGAVLLVPLRIASGVRMKILEAFSRGTPVVATGEAAAGLLVRSGEELLLAEGAEDFADAVRRLQDPERRERSIEAGRAYLRRHHDPAERTDSLLRVYEEVCRQRRPAPRNEIRSQPDRDASV